MRSVATILFFGALFGLVLRVTAAAPPYNPPASSLADLREFKGRWKVTTYKADGKRDKSIEDAPGFEFYHTTFRWRNPVSIYGNYWIDPVADPKRISMTFTTEASAGVVRAIYRLEKDKITIVIGDTHPKSFERAGEKDTETVLIVLERVRP